MEFHFTQPPIDEPWAKAIAQLNRDRELYDAGIDMSGKLTNAQMKKLGFRKKRGIWTITFGKQKQKTNKNEKRNNS